MFKAGSTMLADDVLASVTGYGRQDFCAPAKGGTRLEEELSREAIDMLSQLYSINKVPKLEEKHSAPSLPLKAMSVMCQCYGYLPSDLWDLAKGQDNGGARGIRIDDSITPAVLQRMISHPRFSITSVKTSSLSTGSSVYTHLFLPDKLPTLNFGDDFDRPVTLPSGLIDLTFGKAFQREVNFPVGLQSLTFHEDSVYNLPMKLPPAIKTLTLGKDYAQPLTLPEGLQEFITCTNSVFNVQVDFPTSLKKLQLLGKYSKPLKLPAGLLEISLGQDYNMPVALPDGLTSARFSYTSEQEDDTIEVQRTQILPKSLEHLVWTCPFAVELPDTLLSLDWSARQMFDDDLPVPPPATLPRSLVRLTWNINTDLTTPENLQELELGPVFASGRITTNRALKKITFNKLYKKKIYLSPECEVVGPAPMRRVDFPNSDVEEVAADSDSEVMDVLV